MDIKPWDVLELIISLCAQATFLFITYKFALKQFRMSKASHYLERFMSKDIMDARAVVDKYCDCSVEDMVRRLKEERNEEDANKVKMFANFFQELGIAYTRELVDRKYVTDIFDFLTTSYWTKLQPWVLEYRKATGNNSLYSKWANLATIMTKTDK